MKTKLRVAAVALMMGLAQFAGAQCKDWTWPEDNKAAAEEKYVLHNDLVKNEQYSRAIAPHQYLLKNAPNLQSALYINGEKIFSNLADAEKDPARKAVYVDSLMIIYDMRMQYCGEQDKVMDRKALMAFKYNYKDKSKAEWILGLYDKAFELNGKDMMEPNFKYYMTAVQLNKVYNNNLTDEQILERYDKIQAALDANIKTAKNPAKLKAIKGDVDEILAQVITMDCEKVRTIYGPKFKANPKDADTAEKIFFWMLKDKCTDDPMWVQAGKVLAEVKPDYGLYKNLGLKEKQNNNNAEAERMFQEALKLAANNSEKAEIEIQLGHIDREAGRKSDARTHYRAAADMGDSEGYTMIGYLYMTSFDDCAQKASMVQDRAVFLAAYKYFQMAGNSKQMAAAKEQFPSVAEIFEQNIKKGDTLRVGCWINETVTVDTRD